MRIVAVILAAGEGRRMGGPKALQPIAGTTFLGHLSRLYLAAPVDAVMAVIGAEAERVAAEAGLPAGLVLARNENWREGMLSSVCRGLDAAQAKGADAVLLHPVDHPLVGVPTIEAVCQALAKGAVIAVPSLDGRRGHPAGFAAALFTELRAAPPERGARAVLDTDPGRVTYVPGDAGCIGGINTPEDYRRLIAGEGGSGAP